MGVIKVRKREEIIDVAPTGNIIIWEGNEKLHQVLREIGGELGNLTKARLKICNEIKPSQDIILNDDGNTYTLKSLYELLKTKENLSKDDTIILKSNKISEVLDIIQQLIYIEKIANIYTEEERIKRKLAEKLTEYYPKIKAYLFQIEEFLNSYDVDSFSVKTHRKDILGQIKSLLTDLEKIESRIIKVAVFATKKAGKSMVVNAFLGEEYAPTSLELPTPNVIIYKPHGENNIKLEYRGEVYTFNTPQEVKRFIKEKFEEVSIEGKKLPEMIIYYPRKEGINFELYDTPGPDLAGSEHGDLITKYIEEVDVSIFVIDYSKYTSISEVELLEKIKKRFEKNKKNYSFICAINKVDLIYQDADTEKIKVRVSEFIKDKLETIGFSDFIIIPTTAMMYFYLEQAAKYYPLIREVENVKEFLEKLYEEVERESLSYNIPIEILTALENFVNNLIKIQGIRKPTYEDVKKQTGFDILKEYVVYISQEKAMLERIYSQIVHIENTFTQITNRIEGSKLLKETVDKLRDIIDRFLSGAKEEEERKKFEQFFGELKRKINDEIGDIKETVEGELRRKFVIINKDLARMIKENLRDDLDRLERKEMTKEEFIKKYKNRKIFINGVVNLKDNLKDILNKRLSEIRKKIREDHKNFEREFAQIKNNISEAVKELNAELSKSYPQSINLKEPKLDLELNTEIILEGISRTLDSLVIRVSIHERDISGKIKDVGFFKKILRLLTRKAPYDINKKGLESLFKNETEKAIKSLENKLLDDVDREFEIGLRYMCGEIDKSKDIVMSYLDAVFEPIKNIREDAGKNLVEKENIFKFYTEFEKEVSEFIKLWNTHFKEEYKKLKEGENG